MTELYLTAVGAAYLEAERRKVEEEAVRKKLLEEIAREEWSAHIYDPWPDSAAMSHPKLYEGTGIGRLYGLPHSDRFESELGDWRVIPGSDRP